MRNIRLISFLALLAFLGLLGLNGSLFAGGGEVWMTDYEAAKAKAEAEGKPLLLEFTGSDWCPPCMALDENVFSREAFKAFAEAKVVAVKLDFPRGKEQSAELKAQNRRLAEQFGIEYFPTVLLVAPEGGVIAKTGFRRGGAASYVKHLSELLASAP